MKHPMISNRLAESRLANPEGNGSKEFGLAILSALSIAGIHSAINPSYFTLRSFASKPEARAKAIEGLWIGLGASTLASLGIYFVFKQWLPAIVAEVTAVALFGVGYYAVKSNPLDTVPAINEQPMGRFNPSLGLAARRAIWGRG